MANELDKRESRVMDFIDAKNREIAKDNQYADIQASPDVKFRKLNSECQKGKSMCIDEVLGKIYKDALPFDDPSKNCSDKDASALIKDFIGKRTDGKNSEFYVREALKRNNSSILNTILSESEAIVKDFYKEKAKDIGKINISDLNFKVNPEDGVERITKKLDMDEISSIIQNNVQKAIQDESDKAKREEEYMKGIEDSLTNNMDVTDDTSMESALNAMQPIKQPTVYQPSLFEAIMLGNTKMMTESTNEDIFSKSVSEYTMLSMAKALKLENFTVESVRKLANSYL